MYWLISINKYQLFCFAPFLCSILIIANTWTILHLKNEKMLLFWLLSYNDTETLGFTFCVTCSFLFAAAVQISTTFPCTLFLHTVMPFPWDFRPLTALPFLFFLPIVFLVLDAYVTFPYAKKELDCHLLNTWVSTCTFQDILIQMKKKLHFYHSS